MADWMASRLTGRQEAGRNEEIKVIKAIMGSVPLCPRSGVLEGGNRTVLSHLCVIGQNLHMGERGRCTVAH
jgi:hypothetical protein